MVNTLRLKLWRDIQQLKGQVITITLVVAIGVAVLVASMTTYLSLSFAQDYFYQHYRFADVFANLKRAPDSLAQRIRDIPGVVTVETRVAKEANLDIPNMDEPAVGNFNSLPEKKGPVLNLLHLRKGHWLDHDRRDEILVGEAFAKAHHLEPGNKVVAIINGRRQQFTIAGIVLSPEHVFVIRGQTLLPDNKHYGVFWLSKDTMQAAFGMVGAFNNVVLKLVPTANPAEVIAKLDDLLLPYGGLGAQSRDEQLSHRFLKNEFAQLHLLATLVPSIFILVAAFLLNMVAARLIVLQRSHIAILKALGYPNIAVGLYYLIFVWVIVVTGSVLGTILGIWLGKGLLVIYSEFYVFPLFDYQFSFLYSAIGGGLSLIAATMGALGAVHSVIRLQPSEAMRPQAPVNYQSKWWDRSRLFSKLSPPMKMMIRNLIRRPVRNALTAISIGLGVSIVILGLFWQNVMDRIVDTQFLLAEREHALINYVEPLPEDTLQNLRHLPGVLTVEGFRSVPVRLRLGHRKYLTAILGYPANSQLRLLLDRNLDKIEMNPGQLMLSRALAEILHANLGDTIEIDVLEGKRGHFEFPLMRVIDDYVGLAAYMDLNTVNRMLGDQTLISEVGIMYDMKYEKNLYKKLKETPHVATVTIKRTLIKTFNETFAKNFLIFTTFLAGFAVVISVGIVYNSARIALSERAWELASLRVLGFTQTEVAKILLGELAIVQILGIPIGFLVGYGMGAFSVKMVPVELVRLPLYITTSTYVIAALTTLIAGLISALIVGYRVKHLDLVAVLKTMD